MSDIGAVLMASTLIVFGAFLVTLTDRWEYGKQALQAIQQSGSMPSDSKTSGAYVLVYRALQTEYRIGNRRPLHGQRHHWCSSCQTRP